MTSSPPTSSSTLAPATSSGTSSGGGGGSIFSSASATPLIVAFLAIGLLTTVAIGTLGWRRAYLARHGLQGLPLGHPLNSNGEFRRRERQKWVDVQQRPKLWDMRTVGVGGRMEERTGEASFDGNSWSEKYSVDETRRKVSWQEIMPIAVYPPDCREKGNGRQSADEVYVQENPALMVRLATYGRHLVKTMKHILQGRLTAEGSITEQTREIEARGEETCPRRMIKTEDDRYEDLHVAVAIAMPKPKRSAPEWEVIEYSVGICRIPCHETEGLSNTHDPVTRY
ncbi:hypothetical protein D9757_009509 [Collybiopsis confluens]|uniref:Uncharacterized protein n=1 Tax=Collybiopsis confluens TaxID=2823264 RepID=A0A8H5H8G0_9AGAR|nr:hypothetical protein D9757_009509 [Collybiopsis confluens]